MSSAKPGGSSGRPHERVRGAFARFATGVAVLGFQRDGVRHGMTITSLTPVSLDPALLLVSIRHASKAHDYLLSAPFSVNVLAAEQEDLAHHFANIGEGQPVWVDGEHAPHLEGVLAWFECVPYQQVEVADHTLLIGRIIDFESGDGNTLALTYTGFTEIEGPVL